MLASLSDIRSWIGEDKLEITDNLVSGFQLEAERLIKSSLSGVFEPLVIYGWSTPELTPALIRSIAGELIAAYVYRKAYAEDVPDVPAYAQELYNEAVGRLTGIRAGALIVLDDNDEPIGINQLEPDSATDMYPNDLSTDGPYFTMSKEW